MKYSYKAKNEAGEITAGVREAADKTALLKELKSESLDLVTASEMRGNWFTRANEGFTLMFSKVKTQDKITFAKNLGAMIEAGLPMVRALDVLQRQTKNKKFCKIIADIGEEIKKGKTLSEAMSLSPKVFSQLFISMVHSGEESGSISKSLITVGDQLEKTLILRKKILGAMMYPGIILSVMIVVGVLMMIFVVPTLMATFKDTGVALPWTTGLIISVSDAFVYHWLLMLIVLIAVIIFFVILARTKQGGKTIDWMWLHVPIIGSLIKEINSARTTRTLSSLLTSGVDMLVAMEITEEVIQNSYFKDVIERAKKAVQGGEVISAVFLENQKLFPSFVGEMMSVGEETGKLAPMLLDFAVFYEAEVDQRTKDMSTIIEPFLMVVIGVVVGFFAISVISPMYSVMNNIK